MAANVGVIKAIVSFYRLDSDTAFERHRSRIPINDLNTVHALKKHLIQFLGPKEPTTKYGLGDFDIKLYRMALESAGLCSKNRVLCFRASPVKQRYYAQNYAQLEVLCSNYTGLK